MSYIFPKNTFLQLKHYIQRIYLTVLSTSCVKIHQIPDVIFETISYFSRHGLSVLFTFCKNTPSLQTLYTFDKNIPSKCKFSDIPPLELKFIKFLMSFFKQKVSFSSKFGSLFSVMRGNYSALF